MWFEGVTTGNTAAAAAAIAFRTSAVLPITKLSCFYTVT
jgi:hypothetical protein